ncbi:putative dihydroceramide synthase [Trypanosoma theileri]|uniref:Putative dihydroceramide synthase n=1 Tax=Trypanosoma theileri TaxID=67003 RepID=A0A1X0NPU5_9TRYP|nr:putative dihydroceramide synthase [Trypanosoma theileri]ORC86742.1 putative dihydroceramide synthase [Trypanosoma theileri]
MVDSSLISRTALRPDIYAMSFERAKEYGFVSYYNHTGDHARDLLSNNLTFTREELWWLLTNPFSLQKHLNGWGGLGWDVTILPQLLPCLLWAVAFVFLRIFCQEQLSGLGLYLQVVVPKRHYRKLSDGTSETYLNKGQRIKLKKFQTQVWLALFYILSTAFGYYVQWDKPWFGFPVNEANRISLLTPHPYNPEPKLLHYYCYGLGFYLSEIVSMFMEHDMKRSDFFEYLLHHIVTIALIVISHCSYEHRFGAYVLFIHDASDIMLALSKSINYVVNAAILRQQKAATLKPNGIIITEPPRSFLYKIVFNENVMILCFIAFIVCFFFFRLVCLPFLALATLFLQVKIRILTVSSWFLALLLQVILQGLHVYWFALIVKLAVGVVTGGPRCDIRSDDDETDDEKSGISDGEKLNDEK